MVKVLLIGRKITHNLANKEEKMQIIRKKTYF